MERKEIIVELKEGKYQGKYLVVMENTEVDNIFNLYIFYIENDLPDINDDLYIGWGWWHSPVESIEKAVERVLKYNDPLNPDSYRI